jgi:RNA recognition motif-containing protein
MNRRLYVGNLAAETSDAELLDLFAAVGGVAAVNIIRARDTGDSRGFAFVDMVTESEAASAVTTLHEAYFRGRVLEVTHARVPGSMNDFAPRRGNRRW